MKKKSVLRAAFVRQFSDNDCGMACLAIIFKLSGKDENAEYLRKGSPDNHFGYSLLDLRNVSREMDISCKCVEMEMQFLKACHTPVIIHVKNDSGRDHFVVCFGSKIRNSLHMFLVADPATGIYFISENELVEKWHSKAALYFENISVVGKRKNQLWKNIPRTDYVANLLWLAIPLLNILIAFMGIAITWVIQKQMRESITNRQVSFLFTITLLLLIINIGRALCGYLNRLIMMHVNAGVGEKLMTGLLGIIKNRAALVAVKDSFIRSTMAEMQKIEGGWATLIASFLPDAIFCIVILLIDFMVSPFCGLVNLLFLTLVMIVLSKQIPGIAVRGARVAELKASNDNFLRNKLAAESGAFSETALETIRLGNTKYIGFFRSWHLAINKLNLLLELLGAVNIMAGFAIGLAALYRQSITDNDFIYIVVLSYFLTNIMIRVCVSLINLNDAAAASRNFEARDPGVS
jgi:ABC-type bacteriocin/lantibiotic exporter with double-glycine peptidase domain